jgi:enterochelin esterase-like enzyme
MHNQAVPRQLKMMLCCAVFAVSVFLAAALGTALPQTNSATAGTIVHETIHSASLEGNLLGDTADRNVTIYLPPGYAKGTTRYPVVYLLHGFLGTDKAWLNEAQWADAPKAMDRLIAAGKIREMIVVMPDCSNKFFGSFFTNSVTTGNWEDFITQDLRRYVDSKYRTIALARARGIAGHSMGGYGAIKLAMKHPEIYGAVYGLSACCLEWEGTFASSSGGWQKAFSFRSVDDVSAAFAEWSKTRGTGSPDLFPALVFTALSGAWSPNPARPPLYLDFPVEQGGATLVPVDSAVAAWQANMPIPMLGQFRSNLAQLHAIAFDVGLQDGLLSVNRHLDQALTANNIPHQYEEYKGDHVHGIAVRTETKVLSFFSKALD